MRKVDHQALLQPGEHHISVAQLHALIGRAPSPRRQALWEGLCAFIVHLQRIDLVGMDLWIDGSFLTDKPHPSDVDAVLWVTFEHAQGCTAAQYRELQQLKDRQAIKKRYGVDLYIGLASSAAEETTWRAKFGTCHDDVTAKGFAVLTL